MAASKAAAARIEAFFQDQVATMKESNTYLNTQALQLSDHSKRLEQVISWATKVHEDTQRRTWARLCKAKSDVSTTRHRKDMLSRRLDKSYKDLQALRERSAKLVHARDTLNKTLAADNDALKKEVKKSKKTQAKAKAKAREAAEEIKRLGLLIKEKEAGGAPEKARGRHQHRGDDPGRLRGRP